MARSERAHAKESLQISTLIILVLDIKWTLSLEASGKSLHETFRPKLAERCHAKLLCVNKPPDIGGMDE